MAIPNKSADFYRGAQWMAEQCGEMLAASKMSMLAAEAAKLNPAAVALGRKGGAARVSKGPLAAKTLEQRAEWAAKMVAAKRAKATAAAPAPGKPPATAAGR